MKRIKRLGILCIVLIVCCVATFSVKQVEQYKEQIKNSGEVVLQVSTDSVQTLSWKYEDTELSFHKDEQWLYDEDENFPVDQDKIEELLNVFQEFTAAFEIDEVEDLAQYGLDDPMCTISITTEDQTYEITLGDYSKMDEERYVSTGDGKVYLAQTDPFETYEVVLKDMIKQDETLGYGQITSLTASGAEQLEVTYQEENTADTYCADDVYFAKINGENKPLSSTRMDNYLSTLRKLKLTEYVTYNASEEEIKEYGMDAADLAVTVVYTPSAEEETEEQTEEQAFVLYLAKEDTGTEETAVDSEDSQDEEDTDFKAYARVGESAIIYEIDAATYNKLVKVSYDDLRHTDVFSADFSQVTGMKIRLEDKDYEITSEIDNKETKYLYQEEEIDLTDLKTALNALKSEEFTEESPEQKEEISVTFYLDNEEHPEIEIQFYRYDGEKCLAVINGESVSLIDRSLVVDFIETVNAIVL